MGERVADRETDRQRGRERKTREQLPADYGGSAFAERCNYSRMEHTNRERGLFGRTNGEAEKPSA